MESYRLSPLDHVLEFRVILAASVLWVPVIPHGQMPLDSKPITWRRWLFECAHCVVVNAHRSATETFHVLRRMGYWPTLAADSERWCQQCHECLRLRGQTVQPPMRSIQVDERLTKVLPWHDVIIDMQGPFTRSESGDQYVLSYHCTRLKVPYLAVCRNLQAGHFSRALTECVL